MYQRRFQHQFGNVAETRQVVRGIGKDDVKRLAAGGHKLEHIAAHQRQVGVSKLLLHTLDEFGLHTRLLDSGDMGTSARQELETHSPRSGKQVEHRHTLQVNNVA